MNRLESKSEKKRLNSSKANDKTKFQIKIRAHILWVIKTNDKGASGAGEQAEGDAGRANEQANRLGLDTFGTHNDNLLITNL